MDAAGKVENSIMPSASVDVSFSTPEYAPLAPSAAGERLTRQRPGADRRRFQLVLPEPIAARHLSMTLRLPSVSADIMPG